MRGGPISWRMGVRRWDQLLDCALWMRAAERIEPPPHRLVPGPLDVAQPPAPTRGGDVPDEVLGAEWLGWWLSLVDPTRQPIRSGADLEPAYDTPDPLGLAPYPALRRIVAQRWPEARDWHAARQRAGYERPGPTSAISGTVVYEIERSLGRPLRPFSVEFILLPVRDEVIRRVDAEHYLVPEQVHDSPRWTIWLRNLVSRIG
ncbi:hypothetical protein [Micromonospora sp. HM5-17]|uniref:hypothetical protein n=1 Tax=Micromonospora sp. HM5-17 TaxID=2487710 RepID=UPI000F498AB0|nr:hypothetical protein [Micromonospora sp. HM5-17]